ncbi:MAG: response regulator transcription factor [Flavobacteriales bacterium]
MTKIKSIVIVDDHILIAKALSEIISNFYNFEVIYICKHGKDLQQKIKDNIPDIVLLDINMPVMNGFHTAIWLRNDYPNVLTMALSMSDDDKSLIQMIKNGVKGYMLKNITPKELDYALNQLILKKRYFPDWAKDKVMSSLSLDSVSVNPNIDLSEREIEFLKYTTTQMNYREISENMFCSPRTIENYRDSLFEKLELRTRVGLAVYALKNGYAH